MNKKALLSEWLDLVKQLQPSLPKYVGLTEDINRLVAGIEIFGSKLDSDDLRLYETSLTFDMILFLYNEVCILCDVNQIEADNIVPNFHLLEQCANADRYYDVCANSIDGEDYE